MFSGTCDGAMLMSSVPPMISPKTLCCTYGCWTPGCWTCSCWTCGCWTCGCWTYGCWTCGCSPCCCWTRGCFSVSFSGFDIFSRNFSREKLTTGGSSFLPRQVGHDESLWQQAEQKVWPFPQKSFGLFSEHPALKESKQTSQEAWNN